MEEIKIRECTIKDIHILKEISEKTFYDAFKSDNTKKNMEAYLKKSFSYERIEKELKDNNSKFFFAEKSNVVIGYMKINFYCNVDEKSLEVERIYVLQKYQGNQIGNHLMQKAIEISKNSNIDNVWLGVWEKNMRAIKFYEKHGFKKFDTHIFKLGEETQTDWLMKINL